MQEDKLNQVPQYRAKHKFAQISAQKVRVFADLIRGKYADEAMTLLQCYPNRGARMLEKVLKSAMHNAEDLRASSIEDLRVVTSASTAARWLVVGRPVRAACPR